MQNQRRSFSVTLTLLAIIAVAGALVMPSNASAQAPWSTAGSTGTIDEDSTTISQVKNFTVTLQPGATGSVHIRYNITPTTAISQFCPATQSLVQVRFRNSDDSGTLAKVSFDIHAGNVGSGANTIIYSFDSNGKGNGSGFTSSLDTPAIDFDFTSNVYWIEATVFRSSATQFADLGSILIAESAGTACP